VEEWGGEEEREESPTACDKMPSLGGQLGGGGGGRERKASLDMPLDVFGC